MAYILGALFYSRYIIGKSYYMIKAEFIFILCIMLIGMWWIILYNSYSIDKIRKEMRK